MNEGPFVVEDAQNDFTTLNLMFAYFYLQATDSKFTMFLLGERNVMDGKHTLMYRAYMRENVEELRHRETLAFLVMIMGMISLMGGLTVTVVLANHLSWFFVFPYEPTYSHSGLLGMTLTLLGFGLTSAGFVLAVHYDREKMWFLQQLRDSNSVVDTLLKKGKKKH
jgi:hypothetical protein